VGNVASPISPLPPPSTQATGGGATGQPSTSKKLRESLAKVTRNPSTGGSLPTGRGGGQRGQRRGRDARGGDHEAAVGGRLFSPAEALRMAQEVARPLVPEVHDLLGNMSDLSLAGYALRSAPTVAQQSKGALAVSAWKESDPDYNPRLDHPFAARPAVPAPEEALDRNKAMLMR